MNQCFGKLRKVVMMPIGKRAFIERRSGRNRRRFPSVRGFFFGGKERRKSSERRTGIERRDGWVHISKWSSVPLKQLKISKFIKKG